jgi:hypothetical protein
MSINTSLIAVDGQPLTAESLKMMDYVHTRGQTLSAFEIDVVDHISQTQIRGAEELRHLLAGRRPPGPPVYEALKSGASEWAPWSTLMAGLHDANVEMLAILESAARDEEKSGGAKVSAASHSISSPTVLTLMVATTKLPNDELVAQLWFAELLWKEYALLQRLHLLDHRTQMKKLMAACAAQAA